MFYQTSQRIQLSVSLFAAIAMLMSFPLSSIKAQRIVFPKDPAVINAKTEFGAKGDGLTDDTDALQAAIEASSGVEGKPSRALYLPNGVYRVTHTLVVKSAVGPWLYGESRDGTIIKMDNRVTKVTCVLRTHPRETGPTSADWFMRNLRNFTIDVGDNPEMDGIRYCATNSGIIKNVRVKGRGKIGINSGFIDQSSPNLIQDVLIEGFETGILTQWNWGQTISRPVIRNCRKQGIYVNATAVGIENPVIENTPTALYIDYPNDWTWWGGVVSLLGGRFTGKPGSGPAIINRNILYVRGVVTQGYRSALQSSTPGGNIAGSNIVEYNSHDVRKLFDAPPASLKLPIKKEPALNWETDPKKWVCANEYGAKNGDNLDDTAAIQAAIDAAAKGGKTVVYLRGIGGGDPNWYNVDGEVRVHGSVRVVMGVGWARIIGGANGRFVVDDTSSAVVRFQNIDSFGGTPVLLENRSASNTLHVESCGVRILGNGKGDIFATDCPGTVELRVPGQKMWARQLNPEGDSDTGLVKNTGADLWILGMKCEGKGVRVLTKDRGRTDIAGIFNYGPGTDASDLRPLFDVDNASLSLTGLRELSFGNVAPIKVREKRGTETRTYGSDREGGWIGWPLYSGWNDPNFPYTPSSPKAVGGKNQVTVLWDAMPDATEYTVRRSLNLYGPFTKVGEVTANRFVDAELPEKQTYYYTVTANYLSGNSIPTQPIEATVNVAYKINCGGGAAGHYQADAYYSGGNSSIFYNPIDVSSVSGAAPQQVYQSERWGTFAYTFPELIPGQSYSVRLHFAEIYWTNPGQRIFNVTINGTQVLTNFDIVGLTGSINRAIVREFPALADSKGTIAIRFDPVWDAPKCSGIVISTP